MVTFLSFEAVCTGYNKVKTSIRENKLVILQSIEIIARKQGWSPTPADILVGIYS